VTNSRQKGKAGELEAAHFLTSLFHQPVRRGQQFRGGAESPDVVGLDGLHIEVKRVQKLNLDAAMEQSAREVAAGEIPLVLHRANQQHWKITLYADDVLRLAAAVVKLRPPSFSAPCGAVQSEPNPTKESSHVPHSQE